MLNFGIYRIPDSANLQSVHALLHRAGVGLPPHGGVGRHAQLPHRPHRGADHRGGRGERHQQHVVRGVPGAGAHSHVRRHGGTPARGPPGHRAQHYHRGDAGGPPRAGRRAVTRLAGAYAHSGGRGRAAGRGGGPHRGEPVLVRGQVRGGERLPLSGAAAPTGSGGAVAEWAGRRRGRAAVALNASGVVRRLPRASVAQGI